MDEMQCPAIDNAGARCALGANHAGWHNPMPSAPSPGWAPADVDDGSRPLGKLALAGVAFAVVGGLLMAAYQLDLW